MATRRDRAQLSLRSPGGTFTCHILTTTLPSYLTRSIPYSSPRRAEVHTFHLPLYSFRTSTLGERFPLAFFGKHRRAGTHGSPLGGHPPTRCASAISTSERLERACTCTFGA